LRISERQGQIFLFALAFLLRLVYLLEVRDHPLFHAPVIDSFHHLTEARTIVDGDFLAGAAPYWKPPLYSYFLAIWLWAGLDLLGVRLVQIAMGALSTVLVYRLGCRTLGRPAGWIAGVGLAVYGPAVFFDAEVLMPSLILFLNLVVLLLLVGGVPTVKRMALAGFILGLSAITRPDVLLFGGVAALIVLIRETARRGGSRWRGMYLAGTLVLTLAVPVGAVTIRNAAVSDRTVLVSANGGANFYAGNHPAYVQSSGMWMSFPAHRIRATLEAAGISDSDRFYYRRALRDIREHPSEWLRVLTEKARLLVNGYEISSNRDIYRERESSGLLGILLWRKVVAFPFGIVMPFAFVGILLALRRWREHAWLLGYVGAYSAAMVLFFLTARFRMPLVPALLLFGGYAAHRMVGSVRNARWTTVAAPAVVLFLVFALANSNPGSTVHLPPWTEEHLAMAAHGGGRHDEAERLLKKTIGERRRAPRELLRLATVYEAMGRIDDAIATLAAIEDVPDVHPDWRATAHTTMADILTSNGRAEEAIPHRRRVVEIDPDSSYHRGKAYFHLGLGHFMQRHARVEIGKILESLGRSSEAAVEYRAQIAADPGDPEVLARLALVEVQGGEYDAAVHTLERYLALNPADGSGYILLADALRGAGQAGSAEAAYRRGLEFLPGDGPALLGLAELYTETGRPDEAVEILDSLLTIDADNEDARDLRRRIEASGP